MRFLFARIRMKQWRNERMNLGINCWPNVWMYSSFLADQKINDIIWSVVCIGDTFVTYNQFSTTPGSDSPPTDIREYNTQYGVLVRKTRNAVVDTWKAVGVDDKYTFSCQTSACAFSYHVLFTNACIFTKINCAFYWVLYVHYYW